jgi:hypothetical protein
MPSTVKPAYDESTRMLEVRSDSYRFLRLGEYEGTPARFEVTIRQAPWYGHAGLYFGYRNEPRFGKQQLATYQLFALTHVSQFDPDGNWLRNEFSIRRSRTVIDVDPVEERTEELVGVAFEQPQAQQVRLTIEFGRDKCVAVLVNDEPLSLLASDEVNGKFDPADYRGPWGLYHAGHPVRLAPTWFGDVVVTPLE